MPPAPTSPSQQHTDRPTVVFWAVIAALIFVVVAWKFGAFDSISMETSPLQETAAIPTDLENTIIGLQEIADSGSTSVPILIEQHGTIMTSAAALREGVYALRGRNSSSTHVDYSGTVQIVRRSGSDNIYDLTWKISSNQTQYGVGILQGSILSVGYYESGDQGADAGSVAYFVIDEAHLEGQWASLQGGGAGIEQLSWLSAPML